MVKIRPATTKDAPGIAIIHVKTWQVAYRGLIPKSYLDSLSVEKKKLKWQKIINNLKSKQKIFIALQNNHLVGFVGVGPQRGGGLTKKTGEVYLIYVHHQYFGSGIGTHLLKHSLKFLKRKGFTQATLWVLENNLQGITFYEKRGWRPDGTKKRVKKKNFVLEEIRYRKPL